ncbi:hypothetical protein CP973_01590 [Streptomyces albofaciens JCM 4342]|nr:hypothetical protein CP973_01590 [Streptomyces albofaciens JCM 4342]
MKDATGCGEQSSACSSAKPVPCSPHGAR